MKDPTTEIEGLRNFFPNARVWILREVEPSGNALLNFRIQNNSEERTIFSMLPSVARDDKQVGSKILEPGEVIVELLPFEEFVMPILVSYTEYPVVFDLGSEQRRVRFDETGQLLEMRDDWPLPRVHLSVVIPPILKREQEARALFQKLEDVLLGVVLFIGVGVTFISASTPQGFQLWSLLVFFVLTFLYVLIMFYRLERRVVRKRIRELRKSA